MILIGTQGLERLEIMSKKKEKEVRSSFDDIVGCIVQSLNDNFADYCFNKKQVVMVSSRLRKEGTTSMAFVEIKQDDGRSYFHLIPVKLYKKCNGKDTLIKRLTVDVKNIPSRFKCVYSKGYGKLTIQDYDSKLDTYNLLKIIQFTNDENE